MKVKGTGWVIFAAVMMAVAGVMRIFDSIWAFSYHGTLPQNLEDAIFGHSLKTYGWVYLAVAVILLLAAFGVLMGSQVARWIGVAAGALACISAVWWIPYYPIWSMTYVLIGALVIYGLVVYGGEPEPVS
jgi:hypothetical protein